jgi:hypothetical protein
MVEVEEREGGTLIFGGWRKGKAASGINARCWRFTREGGRDEDEGRESGEASKRPIGSAADGPALTRSHSTCPAQQLVYTE